MPVHNGMLTPTILLVDLTARKTRTISLPPEMARQYLGGPGLGIYLLRCIPAEQEPLVFVPGLLVGQPVLAGCKLTVMGRSPLTGVLGESSASARWAIHLKRLGIDALVLTGCSPQPAILRISSTGVFFDDASGFTGLDIPEYDARHREIYGRDYEPARVASAAERQVKLAGIVFDAVTPRYAARCGLGAAMAAKGVKGISVQCVAPGAAGATATAGDAATAKSPGTLAPGPSYGGGPSPATIALNRSLLPEIKERTKGLAEGGTAAGVEYRNAVGDLVIKNWRDGLFPGSVRVNGLVFVREMSGAARPCPTCPVACTKVLKPETGLLAGQTVRSPEYETTAGFGSDCLCEDPLIVVEANELCDRLGLDTISVSAAIAFTMELHERGLLPDSILADLAARGITPAWGNGHAILALIGAIARREGFGNLLAEGTRAAAEALGGEAPQYAIHVRGLELPYHDPRCFLSIGVTYATAARGASHNESLSYYIEQGIHLPELGLSKPEDPADPAGRGLIAAEMQKLAVLYDAVGLCKFLISGRVGPAAIMGWLESCLGLQLTREELWEAAQRIIVAKRLYAMETCGLRPEDDRLPRRILSEPRPDGGAEGRTVPLRTMLAEYYECIGFDPSGAPARDTIARLGLTTGSHQGHEWIHMLERGETA